jgi:hypothetical protein
MNIFNANFAQYKKDLSDWELRQKTNPSTSIPQGKGKKKKQTDPKPDPPKKPHCRMHHDEPEMLLRLVTFLKIFMASSIDERAIPHAGQLLEDYLFDYKRVSFDRSSPRVYSYYKSIRYMALTP